MAIRLSVSVLVGIIVTLALFYLMQALISGADSALTEDNLGNLVDFVRVKKRRRSERQKAPAEKATTTR